VWAFCRLALFLRCRDTNMIVLQTVIKEVPILIVTYWYEVRSLDQNDGAFILYYMKRSWQGHDMYCQCKPEKVMTRSVQLCKMAWTDYFKTYYINYTEISNCRHILIYAIVIQSILSLITNFQPLFQTYNQFDVDITICASCILGNWVHHTEP